MESTSSSNASTGLRPAPFVQTPPEVKVTIQKGSDALIRLVSVGASAKGRFEVNKEYWRHCALDSSSFNGDVTLTSSAFGDREDESSLNDFFTQQMTNDAIVSARTNATWTAGMRDTPAGRNAYLFQMSHPDGDAHHALGVLFEVEQRTNVLKAVVFYKASASAPTDDLWTTQTIASLPLSKRSSTHTDTLPPPTGSDRWFHTVME